MTQKKVRGFSPARQFAYASDKELGGVWFKLEDSDAEVLVARFGNAEQVKVERRLENEYSRKLKSDDDDVVTNARIEMNRKVYARTVLLGWKNILDEDGETELKYSAEAAEQLLEYPEFFAMIYGFANDLAKFRKYTEDEAVKN